jgi:hypothetical protein
MQYLISNEFVKIIISTLIGTLSGMLTSFLIMPRDSHKTQINNFLLTLDKDEIRKGRY